MSDITLRTLKGSPLTHAEMDGNFSNLNIDKLERTSLGTGVETFLTTPSSANLRAALTDETGTGAAVFADSPVLVGTPTAPTASAGTNTTQVATTAHVFAERTNSATLTGKTINLANNTLTCTLAELNAAVSDGDVVGTVSPAFTGTPTAPTATADTNTTQLATTAFVKAQYVIGTPVASTSGTSIDFTGIPSWVKRITLGFSGLSTSGTSILAIRIGPSTTPETTGYNAVGSAGSAGGFASALHSAYLPLGNGLVAARNSSGQFVLTLINASTNTWVYHAEGCEEGFSNIFFGSGSKSLSGSLGVVRLTTTGGTDTFDAGSVNILYE